MTVAVIGKSSFLAQSVQQRLPDSGWIYLSHDDALADPSWISRVRTVINFAFPPAFKDRDYREALDIDLKLARMIADRPVHYIMASSRLVYGHDAQFFNLSETRPPNPGATYARNKLSTELNLQVTLPPERLTILRLANVFGREINRDLFFGRMLTRLKEQGKIIFNMSPESLRDFYPVTMLADALDIIAREPHGGIFNIGSGFGTPCGDIADWVMRGYGGGKLEVLDHNTDDQYWLNTAKAHKTWPGLPKITPDILEQDCLRCGEWLKTC